MVTDRELMQQALEALDAEAALNVGRIKDALRERLAQPEQDWDWRHPKAQALIGAKARLEITLRLIEQLLEDPHFEPAASDMEYWEPLHDKLQERLAQPEQCQRPQMRRATREEKISRPGVYWVPVNNIANSEAIPEQISEPVQEPVGEIVQAFADLTAVSIPIMPPVGTKLYTTPPRREWPEKLWLWRNHVDGRPEYWAFDNPYPLNLDNDDPQTIGEPCGYAIFKESRDGSRGRTEEYVLNQIGLATFPPRREWVGLTEEEKNDCLVSADPCECLAEPEARQLIEDVIDKLREKNT